jgi:colanic acid/amylovoran biosynthesis glycosyltransferase
MNKVLHLIRKNTQLRASFIGNQITHHREFRPAVVYRENRSGAYDGGFAEFNLKGAPLLDLSRSVTAYENLRYQTTKTLSKRQVTEVLHFIKKHQIDILHFHYGTDCGAFFPLLKHVKKPSVVSFYGYDCSSFPSFMWGYGGRYLKNRVFDRVTKVLAMSPDMKKDLMQAGCPEEKIIVHYYGTDTRRFFMERDYTSKATVTLLILASLVPQKGHQFLLRSLKQLIDSGTKNFTLRIIGTGELEEQLKSFVRENNLSDYVHFTGAIKYASEEMMHEYREADIFVHPSVVAPNGDKEGIPGTIVEAMSAGLPVVSTYHAGIPYIIENGRTGMLVEEHDVATLSRLIERLINDPAKRKETGLTGQKLACDQLDLRSKELELEKHYKTLTSRREFPVAK